MDQNLTNALLITLVGMALVFLALLVLWGLMEVTVQVTAWYGRSHPEEEEEEVEETASVETQNLPGTARQGKGASLPPADGLKPQAAATAVAVALAMQNEAPIAVETQAGVTLGEPSAWKSVMRSAQLNQRSTQFTRKSRGNVR